MSLTDLLGKLKGVRRNGQGWTALCPSHEDGNPSLSLSETVQNPAPLPRRL